MKMTMKKLTQAMAIVPEAMDHLPSENGPGLNVLRPVVTRRTIGVMYEMYSAITDDLPYTRGQSTRREYAETRETYPASEESAVVEKPTSEQRAQSAMTSHTAFTGVPVRGWICFHHLDPGSALSLANAKTTRDASTPCAAPATHPARMTRLQTASIPRLPSASRKTLPIGIG